MWLTAPHPTCEIYSVKTVFPSVPCPPICFGGKKLKLKNETLPEIFQRFILVISRFHVRTRAFVRTKGAPFPFLSLSRPACRRLNFELVRTFVCTMLLRPVRCFDRKGCCFSVSTHTRNSPAMHKQMSVHIPNKYVCAENPAAGMFLLSRR